MTDLNEFKDKLRKIFDRTPKKIEDNIGSSGNGQILFNEEEPEEAAPEIPPPDQPEEQAPEQPADTGSTEQPQQPEQPEQPEQPAEAPPADGAQNPAPAPAPTINQNQNDAQKLKQMFTDSGDLVYDYSLTNEFNQRLFKFKFTYAGIDVNQLMTSNDERTVGALKSELENRLSPEQRFYYVTKWKSLRKKYPEIEKREKNIIIHNTNIMMMVNDDFGEEIPLPEEKKKEAYEKIDKLLIQKFGEEWLDSQEALDFLKNIKINFSNDKPVRTNLLSISIMDQKDKVTNSDLVPFNKIYIDIPVSIRNFLKSNETNEFYNSSSIFQNLISDFRNYSKISGNMDSIIKGTPTQEPTEQDPNATGDASGGDSGGMGGGMGGGDIGGSTDMGGDMTSPDETDVGDETAPTDMEEPPADDTEVAPETSDEI
jgi:hypothetical protein